ncbi:ABC transporter ATP-binding protein [Fusibacter ferrireducens]|uniref:ABC transporter ATP-binding protein n=1 Tax=Fusibacter ferrireducens TaxID=2785058 RepID=A0ABR9ZN81_9FIRM|nr:ABC transporter ATP-binding protein [Fusibacter ferrireducens]MBF4691901.1 ABC transporter ATP-binding protein [Fusibacter ferrireducens]
MKSDLLMVVKDLSVHYPNRSALHKISLEILANEAYIILGPSGCGKTTLLYAIADLLTHKACVEGSRIAPRPLKKSLVLQDYGLFPWKTVLQNVMLPIELETRKDDKASERAMFMLKHLKLDAHLDEYPSTLSGGQKQRVALARSWVIEPDLLLMDEPFSSLDALTREQLQEDVLTLFNQSRMSMITVTHSIEEAVLLGRHILILSDEGTLSHEIINPTFNLERARENEAYYEQCIEIRKLLKEDQYEKTALPL